MGLGKSVDNVKGFLTEDSSFVVVGAIIGAPIAVTFASRFQSKSYPTWAFFIVIGFIFFLVSSALSGKLSAFVKGIALGIFIDAFFTTKFGATISAKLGSLTVSG